VSDFVAHHDAVNHGRPIVHAAEDPALDDFLEGVLRAVERVVDTTRARGGVGTRMAGHGARDQIQRQFFRPEEVFGAFITDPVKQPCADGYSWWLGVSASGTQDVSGSVASLPSVAPARIAVYGRQKL
jgi:hypothetical protein